MNWHSKASVEDYFSKFVFEYLAFIAYFRTIRYIPADPSKTLSDRAVIQRLKQDKNIAAAYLKQVRENKTVNSAWAELKTELDNIPLGNVSRNLKKVDIDWWNCSYDDLNQKTAEEKKLPCGTLRSLDDWENMVEFWHSIRNNLFHGAKDPEVERDQMFVKIGYLTLRPLMEMLL
jgi:hypothetical protein